MRLPPFHDIISKELNALQNLQIRPFIIIISKHLAQQTYICQVKGASVAVTPCYTFLDQTTA